MLTMLSLFIVFISPIEFETGHPFQLSNQNDARKSESNPWAGKADAKQGFQGAETSGPLLILGVPFLE
jgi:hypothetical protein